MHECSPDSDCHSLPILQWNASGVSFRREQGTEGSPAPTISPLRTVTTVVRKEYDTTHDHQEERENPPEKRDIGAEILRNSPCIQENAYSLEGFVDVVPSS